jgi:hypothetical protein
VENQHQRNNLITQKGGFLALKLLLLFFNRDLNLKLLIFIYPEPKVGPNTQGLVSNLVTRLVEDFSGLSRGVLILPSVNYSGWLVFWDIGN